MENGKQVDGNHYEQMAIGPMEYSFRNNLNCHQFSIIKYVSRYQKKNGVRDLFKAADVLRMMLESEYQDNLDAQVMARAIGTVLSAMK